MAVVVVMAVVAVMAVVVVKQYKCSGGEGD